MKETFKDCKTPTDTLDVALREETHGDIIELTTYEDSGVTLIYLDRDTALKLAKTINEFLAT